MRFRYLPMTEQDQQEMLSTIGVTSIDELFADVPSSIRYPKRLSIPEAMDESTLMRHMDNLASKNIHQYPIFLGAGVYDHYIPSVVGHMISRSEFYTAYTPYQPELSQGELQAMFEFQTMICELTGMDVANSSMYDGMTSLAEAAGLAASATKKSKVLVSLGVHPEARQILKTYAKGVGIQVVEVPLTEGITDLDYLSQQMDEDTASVIVQSPNFLGNIEELAEVERITHIYQSLFIVSANPLSLGILKPPGEYGADIVVGDAQPLGIPMSFGGPHCGYFATTKEWMRRIPGRIVGQTVDEKGMRGFVLTLQAREQHIRRDKATSNICSNQALSAIAASVYLSVMGKVGMQEVARLNVHKSHYMHERLQGVKGVEVVTCKPFFNEFVIRVNSVNESNQRLFSHGIIGGYDLGLVNTEWTGHMLIAVTEQRSREEIDQFIEVLEGCV